MSKQKKWNIYKLESVATLISGRTPEREQKEYYATEGIPWVKIENLDQGFVTEAAEYLSDKGKEKVNLVPENSVLFSIVGTVGKVGIAGRELATNQQIVALIFDGEKVLPMYGYYYLRYYADQIRKLSNQTTMALISRKTLGQYRIRVPESLEEQQEIVDKLKKFEEYARQKEQLREQMNQYEGVLFGKMFGQEIRFHEKLALKEFLSESIGTGIPKLEEPESEFPCIRAKDFEKPYLCENHESEFEEGNLLDAEILPDKKYLVKEGDVLLRNGKLFLAEEQKYALYMERNILCIRTKRGQLLPEVLYGWLNLPQLSQKLYGERKEGEGRKRPIRASELEKMQIPYFSMDKQREFAQFLRKIRQIQRSLDEEILYAWNVFQSVAYRYFEESTKEKEQTIKQTVLAESMANSTVDTEVSKDADIFSETDITESAEDRNLAGADESLKLARLVLAVLCGWSPMDERTHSYCQKRREIFKKIQPYFQPVVLSFVTFEGQEEYFLTRDFLTYHSEKMCERWQDGLSGLKLLVKEGAVQDVHLAFQGEYGIATDAVWDADAVKKIAKEGLLLLTIYSGLETLAFLADETKF